MTDQAELALGTPTDLAGVQHEQRTAPLPRAACYGAAAIGDGLLWTFPTGALEGHTHITADFLLEGTENAVFALALLEEGADETVTGEAMRSQAAYMVFGLLNQCQARMRVPLDIVHQNRWMYAREGAWLKPCCYGKRVDLARVNRVSLTLYRMGRKDVHWCMTSPVATRTAPPLLENPILPKGPLIDELGQSTLHEWPAKTRSVDACVIRLREQSATARQQQWPAEFSRWGGFANGPRLEGTGFFRTHHDGKRWFLVDPEGYLFWSAGMDCVGPRIEANIERLTAACAWLPEPQGQFGGAYRSRDGRDLRMFSWSVANFIRAFGPDQWQAEWAKITLAQLRSFGMNTMANWSDWKVAQAAQFPYCRPLNPQFPTTPAIFRDFPDVFHPHFADDCAAFAHQLDDSLGDPAMIGYFLMNEPTWGFATEVPAVGMLYNTPACETRTTLAAFLRERYPTDAALAAAWAVPVTLAAIAAGPFTHKLNAAAERDLADFSTIMVDKLYRGLSDACKRLDPHHLNLGARYYTVPPDWCLKGMTCFDVFSLNAYSERIPGEQYNDIAAKVGRPVMAGEWHFGAHDVGMPASGIGHVPTQADRGKAYRVYLEDAAANPACVGVHYFQMYDQSALGRFDGENYQIGFVDTCNLPYAELAEAALAAHRRMYDVALGRAKPFSDAPTYLPRLFI